jgi:hypothetical protein
MPLQKLQLRPGVNRESTTLANEGTWFEMDKVRFRSGYPEKLGGWTLDPGTTPSALQPPAGSFWGIARSLWNWITLSGANLMAIGTNLKYYIQQSNGGNFYDITPLRRTMTITGTAFTTINGSTTVVVNDAGHGGQDGDFVTISGVVGAVNGIPAAALNREFRITYIDSATYSIVVSSPATSSLPSPTGTATFSYQISIGSEIFTVGVGWGAGGWGGTTAVSASTTLSGALGAVANTVLTVEATVAATTLTVATTAGFTASGSLLIENEIITYSGLTATTFTGCGRGASGTTAAVQSIFSGVVQYSTVTIPVTSTTGFAASGFIVVSKIDPVSLTVVDAEYIKYSGITSTTFTGCVRGYNSTPVAHSSGDTVNQYSDATGWGDAAPAGVGVGIQLRLWSQDNYGQNLILNPRGGALFLWVSAASPNAYFRAQVLSSTNNNTQDGEQYWLTDAGCPEVCNAVAVSDASRFVIAFGCNDPLDPVDPNRLDPLLIRWSDQENYAVWSPAITNQAGSYRLSTGSSIVAHQQTRQEILVWTDAAVYSMQYLGPPYVWGFQILGDNISIAGPNVTATASNITYWMGYDKFYTYAGRVETLYCPLRQYIFGDINLQQQYQFFAGTNEGYNEIWWFYCSISGPDGKNTSDNPNTTVDRYVIYNHLEKIWSYGNLARTAWLDTPLRESPTATGYARIVFTGSILGATLTVTNPPTNSLAVGYRIEGVGVAAGTIITALGTGTGGVGTYTLNTASTVSTSSLFAFPDQPSGQLIYHETGVNDGTTNPPSPISSYIQSADVNIGDGHNYGFAWRMIPDITFDGSTVNNPAVTMTLRPRQNPGSNYSAAASPEVVSTQNYQSQRNYTVQQFTEIVYVRVRGRQMAFRISSNGLGVQWQLGVPSLDVRPDGRR